MGVPIPQFDAEAAAARALEQYDANDDGLLSVEEMTDCSALAKRLEQHDTDADGQLSQQELAKRILSWTAQGTGVMGVPCQVTLDGRPLPYAQVVLQPMEFLGEAIKPATGVANEYGQCSPNIDPSFLPAELSRTLGVQPGLYRVQVTHKTIEIPARYQGEQSVLSLEVADGTISPYGHTINLKKKK